MHNVESKRFPKLFLVIFVGISSIGSSSLSSSSSDSSDDSKLSQFDRVCSKVSFSFNLKVCHRKKNDTNICLTFTNCCSENFEFPLIFGSLSRSSMDYSQRPKTVLLKVKVKGSNPGYLLKYSLLYPKPFESKYFTSIPEARRNYKMTKLLNTY